MVNKVFLLWHAYTTKELLLIGSLTKINNKYVFNYERDAMRAKELGCFLPFGYTDESLYFDFLPSFFAQRMLTSKYNRDKFDIKYTPDNELALLTHGDSVRNSDNFRIVSENTYKSLNTIVDFGNDQNIRQLLHK